MEIDLDKIKADALRRLDEDPETVITDTQEDRSEEFSILGQDDVQTVPVDIEMPEGVVEFQKDPEK